MNSELPSCLAVACEDQHLDDVHRWWDSLQEEARAEFLATAVLAPESIGTVVSSSATDEPSEYDEWYEYIVNQDVRFYFDRSKPQGDGFFKIVYPTIVPISASADAFVVSQLLTRPKK